MVSIYFYTPSQYLHLCFKAFWTICGNLKNGPFSNECYEKLFRSRAVVYEVIHFSGLYYEYDFFQKRSKSNTGFLLAHDASHQNRERT